MIPNRAIFTGDNLPIMRGMNSECVDLIYLDPPFNSNHNYAAPIGSRAAGAAFKDTWTLSDVDVAWTDELRKRNPDLYAMIIAVGKVGGKSGMSYLIYMAVRMLEVYRVLKNTGSIYFHCDPTMSHCIKLMMDAIFGNDNFRNEIVWCYHGPGSPKMRQFNRKTDHIFWYSKGEEWVFNGDAVRVPYKDPSQSLRRAMSSTESFTEEEVEAYRARGKIPENWWEMRIAARSKREYVGYPTQKPLALLERIIKASSNRGDVVFDPFCGCATTLIAAEKLQREWIGIDISKKALDLVKSRLYDEVQVGALLDKLHHRTDLPKRADLGKLPPPHTHKKALYGEQGGDCAGCRNHYEIKDLEIDHIIPKKDGGTDHADNLQLLCGHCNRVKGRRTMEALIADLTKRGVFVWQRREPL